MANAEDTPHADIVFTGIDGNECEAFVAAIRDRAIAQGMDEGDPSMLRYATSRLRGKAMRWHAKLDLTVQKSWYLLVQALFEEYTFVEERDEVGIATPVWSSTTFSPSPSNTTLPTSDRHLTTAQPAGTEVRVVSPGIPRSSSSPPPGGELAPSTRVYNSSLLGYQMGRLRVVYEEGQRGPHYVSTSSYVTSSIQQALIVTFIPSTKVHQIACFGCRESKLGVNLRPDNYSEFYCLGSTSPAKDPVSMYYCDYYCFGNVWSLSPDGTLSATLPDIVADPQKTNHYLPAGCHSTTTVYVEISGMSISFVKDHSTPRATHPQRGLPIVRARIVFQPL